MMMMVVGDNCHNLSLLRMIEVLLRLCIESYQSTSHISPGTFLYVPDRGPYESGDSEQYA